MKKALIILLFFSSLVTEAQNPVSWKFTAKKQKEGVYEIHMLATIQKGWHLYSQKQPENAIAIPTLFSINKNPLLIMKGKIREIGKLEIFKDKKLGLAANQYSTQVDFIQIVSLKGKAKTNFMGNVEFQTCDDTKCLPPKIINFNVVLD